MQYTILLFSYHRKHHFFLLIFDLPLNVQFDYEISWRSSEISRHTEVPRRSGWESLLFMFVLNVACNLRV
jgi:hypothetical protein